MKKTFFNIGILSVSNIFVRIIGLLYKVWLAKEISPVALGIYQLSMSVYSVFVTPIAAGLPNATNRLCAKYLKENKSEQILYSAIKIALFPLILSAMIMLLGKDLISEIFLHQKNGGILIIALIPAVTLGAIASVPAGYLHSIEKTTYPALFEIIEQLSKIVFVFILFRIFAFNKDIMQALIPVSAVSFGGIVSFVLMFASIRKLKLKKGNFNKEILANALPPTFARLATSVLHLFTTTILPLRLVAFGLTKEAALSLYGILTSMAYPVVFAPMTILGAMCVVFLPEIAKNLDNYKVIKHKFTVNILFSLLITVLFSVFLLLFAPFLAKEIFHTPQAGTFMVMLIPSVIFLGLTHSAKTTLNGLGKQKTLFITSVIDGLVGLILTFILSRYFGIYGFILGNCIQDFLAFIISFILCVISIRKIKKV